MKIIGVGDNVCDVYADRGLMYPGGQALNVAVFAQMLGIPSAYMGVFGNDRVSRHVRETLAEKSVKALRCRWYDEPNGYAMVTHEAGDRVFLGSNRGGALRTHPLVLDEEDLSAIAEYTLLHTSNNSYLDRELPKLAALPTLVSYDFSGAWRDRQRAEAVCPHIDFAFLSLQADEKASLEETARAFHAMGAKRVVLTMGAQGAWHYDGHTLLHQPPQYVEAMDTLGAGDSFAAAYLVEMLRGKDAAAALASAAEFSSRCCLTDGAFGHAAPVDEPLLAKMQAEMLPPQAYRPNPA